MQPEALKYLYDIREAALKIQRFTAHKDEQDYAHHPAIKDDA